MNTLDSDYKPRVFRWTDDEGLEVFIWREEIKGIRFYNRSVSIYTPYMGVVSIDRASCESEIRNFIEQEDVP